MGSRALIVGGSGQIGRAVAQSLLSAGWHVIVADRGTRSLPDGLDQVERRVLDRDEPAALATVVGASGLDALIDVVPYTAGHAQQLVEASVHVGVVVAISSASVYTDAAGRTIDEAGDADGFPDLPLPIPETQRTVAPGEATYSTRKAAMERTLLDGARSPATVVRPCAIHGPGSRHVREWHFLRRALDRRAAVILDFGGESVFHTTSVSNLAEVIRLAAERPGTRVVNCGDPDPPSVLEIGRLVCATEAHEPVEILLPGPAPRSGLGDTPWSLPRPLVLDMSVAQRELGYQPVTSYAAAVKETCAWLSEAVVGRDWRDVLPDLARYWSHGFDYQTEDSFIAALAGPD